MYYNFAVIPNCLTDINWSYSQENKTNTWKQKSIGIFFQHFNCVAFVVRR